MTKKAAIYACYNQEGDLSIDFQLEECREYIKEAGLSLVEDHVFIDKNTNGQDRDEFRRMVTLGREKDHPFDVVVCYATSSFSCSLDEAHLSKACLRRNGVDVKFVSLSIPDGHMGKLVERILEWRDEMDRVSEGQEATLPVSSLAEETQAI